MLTVIDLSNHQKGLSLASLTADAFIFKATEGTYFIDEVCATFIKEAKALNKPYGLYHFLDQSDVIYQAQFFLEQVAPYLGEAMLILDYEGYGKQGATEAKRFLDYVYQKTQIRPLIYMNESDANSDNWHAVQQADYGLWVAKYSKNSPHTPQWPTIAMWQYTSTPLDHSHFYGDLNAFKAYGNPTPSMKPKDRYHTHGKRFKALKDLMVYADETFKKQTGLSFSKHSIFEIETLCHTETTTHARLSYNRVAVYVTLHKEMVEWVA